MNVFEELVEAGAEELAVHWNVQGVHDRKAMTDDILTAALERALEPDVLEGLARGAEDRLEATTDLNLPPRPRKPGVMMRAIELALRALLDQKEAE